MNTVPKTAAALIYLAMLILAISGCVHLPLPEQGLFPSHFAKEIDLFEPLRNTIALNKDRKSKKHWDGYFDDSAVVALGIEKSWIEYENDSDGGIEANRDERIEWIWVRNREVSSIRSTSRTNISIVRFTLLEGSASAAVGKGRVRFGPDQYPVVYSVSNGYSKDGAYDLRTIVILDGASVAPALQQL